MDQANWRNISNSLMNLAHSINENEQQLNNLGRFTETLLRIEERLTTMQNETRENFDRMRLELNSLDSRSAIRTCNSHLHAADSVIHWIQVNL